MDLGKRLKEARERADLSQEALARRADVSTVAVSQIEQGRTKEPHYLTLHKLSKVLGVSPHWLYTGEELEEPVLLGKAEAPTDTGQEEERRVRAFLAAHPSEEERVQALEETASIIGRYNDRWRSEVDDIEERGILPYGRSVEMHALFSFISDAMTHKGIRDYVEGVGVEASEKEQAAIIRLQEAWVEMFNLANRMREVERVNRTREVEGANRESIDEFERAIRESIDEVERAKRESIDEDYVKRGQEQLQDYVFEEAEKRRTEERPQW